MPRTILICSKIEIEVGVELGIVEHEGAVLGALGDGGRNRLVDVLLAEVGSEAPAETHKGHG